MKTLRTNLEPVYGSAGARSYACQPMCRSWFDAVTTTDDTRAIKHGRPREHWKG